MEDYAEEIIAWVEDQRGRTLDESVAATHERRIPGSRTALFRVSKHMSREISEARPPRGPSTDDQLRHERG